MRRSKWKMPMQQKLNGNFPKWIGVALCNLKSIVVAVCIFGSLVCRCQPISEHWLRQALPFPKWQRIYSLPKQWKRAHTHDNTIYPMANSFFFRLMLFDAVLWFGECFSLSLNSPPLSLSPFPSKISLSSILSLCMCAVFNSISLPLSSMQVHCMRTCHVPFCVYRNRKIAMTSDWTIARTNTHSGLKWLAKMALISRSGPLQNDEEKQKIWVHGNRRLTKKRSEIKEKSDKREANRGRGRGYSETIAVQRKRDLWNIDN